MARPRSSTQVTGKRTAGVTLYTEGVGLNEATVIESTTVGTSPSQLLCNCPAFKKKKPGQARWCVHVEKVYREALDAHMWNPLQHDEHKHPPRSLPSLVEVTMFVRTKSLLVTSLDEADDNGLRKAYVVKSSSLEAEPPEFIGFLGNGDGRYVIRGLLQDWILECLDIRSLHLECPSPFHFGERGIEAPHPDQATSKSQVWVGYMAQAASILTTGFCSVCHLDSYVPEVD